MQCQGCQRYTHQLSARALCPACEDKERYPRVCEVCDSDLDVLYYRATDQDLCVDCRADRRLGYKEREKP